jgi:hypothetical protein
MWIEVSPSAPHFLQVGLLLNLITYMFSQGVMSSEKASNNPGLRPVKGQGTPFVTDQLLGPNFNLSDMEIRTQTHIWMVSSLLFAVQILFS